MFRKIVIFFVCVMWSSNLEEKNDFLKEKKIDKNQKSITARSDVCWDKGVYVKREGRLSFSRGICVSQEGEVGYIERDGRCIEETLAFHPFDWILSVTPRFCT